MREVMNVSGVYRHFKGDYYIIEDIVSFEEGGDLYVIYRSLTTGKSFVRPINMFLDEIEINREDNVARQRKRFQYICRNEDVIC